jgi:hypothetical protein
VCFMAPDRINPKNRFAPGGAKIEMRQISRCRWNHQPLKALIA